jgi:hypothetical protein
MDLVDPTRLRASVNANPEFRLAARYWNATLSLESPSRVLRVEIADGQVASCRESDVGQLATITVLASDDGWAQFLAAVPSPFYQDLIGGCVQHHGFRWARPWPPPSPARRTGSCPVSGTSPCARTPPASASTFFPCSTRSVPAMPIDDEGDERCAG